MRRTAIIVIAAIFIGLIGIFAWRTLGPGPLAFAGGSIVTLADYHEANPTGVPAELAAADIVKRGEYLAKAADCLVCHTAPGGADYAGGLAFRLPFGTLFRLTSPPTRTPASAAIVIRNFSTPCSAASAKTVRAFIRPCPTHHIPS